MPSPPSLLSIIALARSGALERAWAMFREAGYEAILDDPAVLALRGRLLKDKALAAAGEARRQFYEEAAAAYARAAELGQATYPLINAATLSLLAGRKDDAVALAQQVLVHPPDEDETAYYRAATRAEAQLLLGDVAAARAQFDAAIAAAPRAFEDHASTLRQFALILDATGGDKAWLDARRPPRSLHFAGHIALAGENGALARAIRAFIAEERIGWGYGALAAGADILIAEALREAGAELHLVLPAPPEVFRAVSVARFGADWAARFDTALAAAAEVEVVQGAGDPLSPLALRLAAEIAMGKAAMQAELLMSEAVQLLVVDGDAPQAEPAGGSGWIGALWQGSGRRRRAIQASRAARADVAVPATTPDSLLALLRIRPADPASIEDGLAEIARALSSGPAPALAPRWTGEAVLVGFAAVADAAKAARAVAATGPHAVAGHYAVVRRAADPFGGPPLALGDAVPLVEEIARSTPEGAVHVGEHFAAALHAGGLPAGLRTEAIGELPRAGAAVRLFSLKR